MASELATPTPALDLMPDAASSVAPVEAPAGGGPAGVCPVPLAGLARGHGAPPPASPGGSPGRIGSLRRSAAVAADPGLARAAEIDSIVARDAMLDPGRLQKLLTERNELLSLEQSPPSVSAAGVEGGMPASLPGAIPVSETTVLVPQEAAAMSSATGAPAGATATGLQTSAISAPATDVALPRQPFSDAMPELGEAAPEVVQGGEVLEGAEVAGAALEGSELAGAGAATLLGITPVGWVIIGVIVLAGLGAYAVYRYEHDKAPEPVEAPGTGQGGPMAAPGTTSNAPICEDPSSEQSVMSLPGQDTGDIPASFPADGDDQVPMGLGIPPELMKNIHGRMGMVIDLSTGDYLRNPDGSYYIGPAHTDHIVAEAVLLRELGAKFPGLTKTELVSVIKSIDENFWPLLPSDNVQKGAMTIDKFIAYRASRGVALHPTIIEYLYWSESRVHRLAVKAARLATTDKLKTGKSGKAPKPAKK